MCSLTAPRQLFILPKLISLRSKSSNKNRCAPVYEIKTAICAEREEVKNFLYSYFYREDPLRIGASPIATDPKDERFHLDKIPLNTCILAVKPDSTIIAAIIAGCKTPNMLANMAASSGGACGGKWAKILAIWARADKEANIFNRFNSTRSLHAYLLAVHRNYRNYGFGTRMIRELAKVGKKQRYDLMSIDATNIFVACACKRLGLKLVNTLNYKTYMDEKGLPIFSPPHPHDALRTYVMHL